MADPSIERFRRVVSAAAAHLEERRKEVNDLNVFPVADGDTGDNMALTLRAVSEELDRLDGQMVDEIGRTELVNALARAALMGARGNSGVILSQIVRGAAEELASRPGELVDPMLVAAAFARAAEAAYESVREPAEGTMLTVFREMATSISRRLAHMQEVRLSADATPAEQDALLAELLEDAVRDGEAAVARTPEQLEVLRESGVVDAGAHGLVVILAGVVAGPARRRRGLAGGAALLPGGRHPPPPRGQPVPLLHELHRHRHRASRAARSSRCWRSSATRSWSSATRRPSRSTSTPTSRRPRWRSSTGRARSVSSTWPTCASRSPSGPRGCRRGDARPWPSLRAAGCGSSTRAWARSSSTGARPSIPRSTTCSPRSTRCPPRRSWCFPNNPNVVMAAERAAELSDKEARVVPCTSQQAGVAALVELDPTASIDENAERMGDALAGIRAGSVAPAARDDAKGRFVKGDAVGFVGDEIVAWGGAGSTLGETMARLAEGAEILTVVGGEGAPIALADLEGHAPAGVELELHEGGQPHYWWLLAAQ